MAYSPAGSNQPLGDATANTPTSASVGTSSTQIVAENLDRRFLFLFNSGNFDVFLSGDGTALLNKGFILEKGVGIELSRNMNLTTSIHGITLAASSDVLILEFE